MTTFDQREQAFETKFAMDEELKFKTVARRNHLLGFWAAHQLEMTGAEADRFTQTVVLADLARGTGEDVLQTVIAAFTKANLPDTESDIRREMDRLLEVAKIEMQNETKTNL